MTEYVIKTLKGHSGCKIDLINKNNKTFVRKIASSTHYNLRLKKQCLRQSMLKTSESVKTPKIIATGLKEGLFYFDMEFIPGKTLAEYSEHINKAEIKEYISRLFETLYISNEKYSSISQNIFLKKIISLEYKLKNERNLDNAFQILKKFDWTVVPKTPCHGDLTFENIMVTSDKRIYLIDFLDSFYGSWMIDIAKLLQDIYTHWSWRNKKMTMNIEYNLNLAQETLIKAILSTKNGEKNLETIYHLLLLNLIRIYPYIQDNKTYNFLNASVKKLEIYLREGVINCEKNTNYTLCR